MGKIALFLKRFVVLTGILLSLWLPMVAFVQYLNAATGKEILEPIWITRAESLRLMRYHGTNALKVTRDRAYIRRDSRWIQVLERREGGPQESGGTPALPVSS